MPRLDPRIQRLIATLDDLGMTWLANEIRTLSTTPEPPAADLEEVIRAQREAEEERYERRTMISAVESIEAASYATCLQYLAQRIRDTAEYLRASGETLQSLGPPGVRLSHWGHDLGGGATEATQLNEAVNSLRRISHLLVTELQGEE